ncbi:MAG: TasA family protein, partial [Actinomycetota bacterium]
MTRKILSSLMVIALAAMLIGLGTFAYFSDTGTSNANTFTAGTLNLVLNDSNPDAWADGASGTWNSPANWAPGEEVTATLRLANSGST